MGVENGEDVGGKSFEGETKRDVHIVGKLEPLGAGDSMKKADEFMSNGVVFKEEVVFDSEENIGGVEDGSIEEVDGVSGEE